MSAAPDVPFPARVRAATAADVPALAELERRLFAADAWSADALAQELGAAGRAVVVHDACPDRGHEAGEDGSHGAGNEECDVLGWAVAITAGDVVDLARLGVHPGHRRAGVAHGLLARVLADAATAGAERMLLEVSSGNAGALAFYAREGFERVDVRPGYYGDGTDAIILQRRLGPAATEEEAGWR